MFLFLSCCHKINRQECILLILVLITSKYKIYVIHSSLVLYAAVLNFFNSNDFFLKFIEN